MANIEVASTSYQNNSSILPVYTAKYDSIRQASRTRSRTRVSARAFSLSISCQGTSLSKIRFSTAASMVLNIAALPVGVQKYVIVLCRGVGYFDSDNRDSLRASAHIL